jgi:hypothetical protein
LGADKNYEAQAFVEELKDRKIEPHIAINGSVSRLARSARRPCPGGRGQRGLCDQHGLSQTDLGNLRLEQNRRRPKARGLAKVQAVFAFGLIAYDLARLPRLLEPMGAKCVLREGNSRK